MGTFVLTRAAKSDLKSIAAYTQRMWGKEQRRIYLRQFDNSFHMLAETPDVGIKYDFIKLGYKKFPNASHLIFYRCLSDDQIEIVRILHKRMDAQARLENP